MPTPHARSRGVVLTTIGFVVLLVDSWLAASHRISGLVWLLGMVVGGAMWLPGVILARRDAVAWRDSIQQERRRQSGS